MDDGKILEVTLATLITQIFMFGTMIWRDWANERKAKLLRAWDMEDRANAREKVAAVAIELKEAIVENTALTGETMHAANEAYRQANSVSQKLETIGITQTEIQKAGFNNSDTTG